MAPYCNGSRSATRLVGLSVGCRNAAKHIHRSESQISTTVASSLLYLRSGTQEKSIRPCLCPAQINWKNSWRIVKQLRCSTKPPDGCTGSAKTDRSVSCMPGAAEQYNGAAISSNAALCPLRTVTTWCPTHRMLIVKTTSSRRSSRRTQRLRTAAS